MLWDSLSHQAVTNNSIGPSKTEELTQRKYTHHNCNMHWVSAPTGGQLLFGPRHKRGQRLAGLHEPYITQEEAVVLGLRGCLFYHGQCFHHAAIHEAVRVARVMFHHVYGLLQYHPPDPGALSVGLHVSIQRVDYPLDESVLDMAVL